MKNYAPPRTNHAGIVIPVLLFAIAAVCLITASLGYGIRLFLQLIGALSAVAGIQLSTRFQLISFTYVIGTSQDIGNRVTGVLDAAGTINRPLEFNEMPISGADTLAVSKIQGKRSFLICNLPLSKAIGCDRFLPYHGGKCRNALTAKYGKLNRIFNFCPSMFPREVTALVFEANGERAAILLETDESFHTQLVRTIAGQTAQ